MTAAAHVRSDQELKNEFIALANQIAAFFCKYGKEVTGYHSTDLPYFSVLPPELRLKVLSLLKNYLTCLEGSEEGTDAFDDSNRSVWHAMRMLQLTPSSELFSHLKPDALVEIYDTAGLQIWRNLNFMSFCSYTLEEIHCLEWNRRYTRDAAIDAACFEAVGAVISGKTPEIYFPSMPKHVIEETCSEERLVFSAHYDILSPLRGRSHQIEAWLVMTSAKIIGQRPRLETPRLTAVPSMASENRPQQIS